MAEIPKCEAGAVRVHEWAGRFYPAKPTELKAVVQQLLDVALIPPNMIGGNSQASRTEDITVSDQKASRSKEDCALIQPNEPPTELPDHQTPKAEPRLNPKAIISPHAGYIYSGPIAGKAYAPFQQHAKEIRRIVLLGPSHYVPFSGLASCTFRAYSTPLGEVPIDTTAISQLASLKQVCIRNDAHEHEHSLEVQLPFLQCILNEFTLIPLVVGDASEDAVAEVLEALWGGAETRIVISSDLSHFLDYNAACQMDKATASAIQALCSEDILDDHACGRYPVKGMLHAARKAGLKCQILDLRNSGDIAGPKNRVVGYGAFAFY
jgi:hypothetical protein